MTFDEARALVDSVRYGPAFPLKDATASLAPGDAPGSAFLFVSATVFDRDDAQLAKPTRIGRRSPVEIALLDRDELLLYLCAAWRDFVLHEVDEGIWVDGRLLRDPHAPGQEGA